MVMGNSEQFYIGEMPLETAPLAAAAIVLTIVIQKEIVQRLPAGGVKEDGFHGLYTAGERSKPSDV